MELGFGYVVFFEDVVVAELDVELELEEFAVRLRPQRVLLDQVPQVSIFKESFPLRILQRVQGVVTGCLLLFLFDRLLVVLPDPFLSLPLLHHYLDDVLADELLVLEQRALHERNPLVFIARQVAQTDLPQEGSDGVELENEAIAVEGVILHCIFVVSRLALPAAALLEESFTLELDSLPGFAAEKEFYFPHRYDVLTENVVYMAQRQVFALQLSIDLCYLEVV